MGHAVLVFFGDRLESLEDSCVVAFVDLFYVYAVLSGESLEEDGHHSFADWTALEGGFFWSLGGFGG